MTNLDLAVVDELLTTTRSVRRRLDLEKPVDQKVIEDCIRLALQSPTGGNRQGWRWLVVTDPELRRGLADLYREGESGLLRSRAEKYRESDPATSRVYESADYLAGVLDQVPVHVIPCIEGRLTGFEPFEAASHYGSILPAVWSFQLALRSRGLGSVLTTLHLAREAEAARLLGIPDNVMQVALIPVAHADPRAFKPAAGRDVSEVMFLNHWGD
ncbi:MAG TPA: nitroreductase family protein [Pseudonocardia sp.]|jgi:nitroreductase|nr:nitroreductase family protein [Pseudonocardia sp.]